MYNAQDRSYITPSADGNEKRSKTSFRSWVPATPSLNAHRLPSTNGGCRLQPQHRLQLACCRHYRPLPPRRTSKTCIFWRKVQHAHLHHPRPRPPRRWWNKLHKSTTTNYCSNCPRCWPTALTWQGWRITCGWILRGGRPRHLVPCRHKTKHNLRARYIFKKS